MLRHIRFLESGKTICENPELLDSDFVTVDYEPYDAPSCRDCSGILMAHNERETKVEKAWFDIVRNYNATVEDDPLSAARGLMLGLTISSGFWLGVFFIGVLLGWWM